MSSAVRLVLQRKRERKYGLNGLLEQRRAAMVLHAAEPPLHRPRYCAHHANSWPLMRQHVALRFCLKPCHHAFDQSSWS